MISITELQMSNEVNNERIKNNEKSVAIKLWLYFFCLMLSFPSGCTHVNNGEKNIDYNSTINKKKHSFQKLC